MLHYVVSQILPNITVLSFADKVGGIVYPAQRKMINEDGEPVIKTFPIYGNDATVCNSDEYIDMVMDDRLKSVIYFEATPETIVSGGCDNYITTSAQLTLVGWFNLAKINKTLRSAEGMLRILAAAINGKYKIGSVTAVISIVNINFRDPAIFSRWSYIESDKQHLIYPRDFGAIQFDVQLSYPLCDDEPIIDPAC